MPSPTARCRRRCRRSASRLPPGAQDRAGAYADLGEALEKSGDVDDAKRQALAALEVAPSYVRAQDLLLRLVEPRQ